MVQDAAAPAAIGGVPDDLTGVEGERADGAEVGGVHDAAGDAATGHLTGVAGYPGVVEGHRALRIEDRSTEGRISAGEGHALQREIPPGPFTWKMRKVVLLAAMVTSR